METGKKEVQERTKHPNIFAALSAFQGELKPMVKSGHVEFTTLAGKTLKFDFTPFGEIMQNIYPLLAKHGLSLRHYISKDGIEAILAHETYELKVAEPRRVETKRPDGNVETVVDAEIPTPENEIRSGIVKLSQGGDMKEVGAAITYGRRYTTGTVLGLSSEDDKDTEILDQSAKNAIQTVFDRFKNGVEKAQTTDEITKSIGVLRKDLKSLEAGKAPALGLAKEQYEELIKIGEARIEQVEANQDPKGKE